uniref:Ribonuclease P/MRP subunit p38 n=1 Tax=Falco tinnunculus TaxID=100819 RepID=A0A8C4XM00_FALTI
MSVIQPGTATLRKAKKTTVKTCLDNPFVFQWKTIDGEDMHFILQTLEERIKHSGLKKIETPRKKKRALTKKQMERKCDASTSELPKEEETEDHQQKPGWTDISIRRQLAIGVNEVTKALEKNELLLLLNACRPGFHLIPGTCYAEGKTCFQIQNKTKLLPLHFEKIQPYRNY